MKRIYDDDLVLNYIQKFMDENGYAPTVREICRGTGISSTCTVFLIMERLAKNGLINKRNKQYRAVAINGRGSSVTVPLIGTVAAGTPIFATENYDGYYSIPSNFFSGEDLFMLNVQGSSMIKIGMFDGDKIVVHKQDTAENGDIVVALVDDSATVKRFFKRGKKIILHPENDDMEDFIFDDVKILGKVVGLMRNI